MESLKRIFMFVLVGLFLTNFSSAGLFDPNSELAFHEEGRNGKWGYYEVNDTDLWFFNNKPVKTIELIENEYSVFTAWNIKEIEVFRPTKLFDKTNYLDKEQRVDRKSSISSETHLYREWETKTRLVPSFECLTYETTSNQTQICSEWENNSYTEEYEEWSDWKTYNFQSVQKGLYQTKTIVTRDRQGTGTIDWVDENEGWDLVKWAPWWDTDWEFKKEISNFSELGTLMTINISYNANMNNNFSDLRILNNAENTELGFLIRDKVDGEWILIDLNNSEGDSPIFIYYGNSGATTTTSSLTDVYGANMISFWELDETTGTTAFDELGTNDLTNFNSVAIDQPGQIVTSYDFSPASNTHLQKSTVTGMTDISINVWANVTGQEQFDNIFELFDASPNTAIQIFFQTDNTIHAQCGGTSCSGGDATTDYTSYYNSWTMITATYNDASNEFKLYLNGISVANDTATTFVGIANIDELTLGNDRVESGALNGAEDEFKLFDKVLSQEEVSYFSNNTQPTYTLGAEQQDILPPSVVLISPANDTQSANPIIDFVVNVTDNLGVQNATLFIDGVADETNSSGFNGTYTFIKTLSVGEHNWSILAYNDANLSNQSETRTINITTEIDIILNAPPNDTLTSDTNVTFNFTITPNGVNTTNWTLTVWFDNGTIAHQHINTTINTNESVDVIHDDTLFFDASYIWNVETFGVNGITVSDLSENRTFRIDTIPPVVNITYPPESFIVTIPEQNVTVNYTVVHPVGDLSNCFLNTSFNSTPTSISCTTNTTSILYPNTDPASLIIYVWANDTAGNLGVDNVTILKDTTVPQIEFVSPSTEPGMRGQDYIVANVSVVDDGFDTTTTFLYNLTDLVSTIYNSTTPSINNFTNLPDTTYFLNATANDSFGNTNSTETRTIILDTTKPQIEFVSPTTENGTFDQSFIISNVTAVDGSLDTITTFLYNSTSLITSTQNSTSPAFVNLTGLPSGEYFLNATANDTFGNSNSTQTRTIYLLDGSLSGVWTDEYQVRIIAFNLTESDLEINNVVVTQEETNLWKINTTEGDNQVARAQVMRTFFADNKISLVTGLLKIQTQDTRDINKSGFTLSRAGITPQPITRTRDATFTSTINNENVSSWSNLLAGSDSVDEMWWEIEDGTIRNNARGDTGASDELGTDTTADQIDNPTNASMRSEGDAPNADNSFTILLLSNSNITWSGLVDETERNFFDEFNTPRFSPMPNITLNAPENNFQQLPNTSIVFNVTSTVNSGTLNEIKLFLNDILNETQSISGTENTTIFNKSFNITGNYNWTVEVCDDNDNCALSETRDIIINPFIEINQTFEENITEGETNDFSVLINVSDSSSLTNATFSYNNTNYSTTIIFSSGLYLISSSIISPNVDADTNFSFNFFLVIDGITYATTSNNQTVFNSLFDICGGLSNDTLLNMSLVDEETGLNISGDIEIAASIVSKSSGSTIGTINKTFEDVEYGAICFSPTEEYSLYYLNTEIRYSSDGYAKELYYIQNGDMADYPRNLSLFDLNQTDSTEFVITFQNDAFILVEGAVIQLQRKYIGEDVYKVVEAPVTADGGKAIVHIDLNTNIYRASVVKDGELLKFFDDIVFSCDNELAGECEQQLRGNVDPNNDVPIESLLDFSYSVSVSDDNNTVDVLFAVPSGTPSSVNVVLEQIDMFGNVTSCNTTVITSAGSITCDFSDTIEKSILQLTISKDGTQLAITNYGVDPELDMDGMNFFIVFLFLISLVGMAIASPEWMMIIGIMVFMISGTLLLLKGMSLAMGLGAMAWLVVAVIIIILKMAKQEDR